MPPVALEACHFGAAVALALGSADHLVTPARRLDLADLARLLALLAPPPAAPARPASCS